MNIRKGIFSILLIGFLFNVFHDFIFYNIDPCMEHIETVLKFDKGQKNDDFCKLHHELHMPMASTFYIDISISQEQSEHFFLYKSPPLKQFKIKPFKPPTLS